MNERPISRELADRYYLAFCERFHLDPDEQESARAFEDWYRDVHGDGT